MQALSDHLCHFLPGGIQARKTTLGGSQFSMFMCVTEVGVWRYGAGVRLEWRAVDTSHSPGAGSTLSIGCALRSQDQAGALDLLLPMHLPWGEIS